MDNFFGRGEESDLRLRVRQLLTALGPLLGVFMAGLSSGYSAVLLPELQAASAVTSDGSVNSVTNLTNNSVTSFTNYDNFTNNLTYTEDIVVSSTEEESWIASSVLLPMAPGCWFAGFMIEMLGRKRSTLAIFPFFVIGWLAISLAKSVATIIIGRVICGFCAGLFGPLAPVYISETSDPKLRGVLLSLISVTLSFGILVVHAVCIWLHWRITAYVCVAFATVGLLTALVSKESPTWLINKGRTDEALESWVHLRGWRSLSEYQALENSKTARRKSAKRSILTILKETFSSRHFLWPLSILCVFFFAAQFSGYSVVIFYSVEMLMEVTGPDYANVGTLVIDVVRLVVSIFTCYLIRRCNRRTLTHVSGCGTSFFLFLLSLCLYYDIGRPWGPCILLVLYIVSMAIGLTPLPWILCGELFPRRFRGLGSGLTSAFAFIFSFTVVKIVPSMFRAFETHGTFAIYGVLTLLGTGFLYCTLPETKDKTLQEVERAFDRKSDKSDTDGAELPVNELKNT
ncbi:trehalose transporter 1-like protein [Augochlora pura]